MTLVNCLTIICDVLLYVVWFLCLTVRLVSFYSTILLAVTTNKMSILLETGICSYIFLVIVSQISTLIQQMMPSPSIVKDFRCLWLFKTINANVSILRYNKCILEDGDFATVV